MATYFPAGGALAGGFPNATLSNTGVTAGTYASSNITINASGLITSATSGGTQSLKFLDPTGSKGDLVEIVYNDATIAGARKTIAGSAFFMG